MRTACGACSKEFASSEATERHHIRLHKKVQRAVGGVINGRFVRKWPDDPPLVYRDGQRWGDYADLAPQCVLKSTQETGANSSVLTQAIAGHVGADFQRTPCLCDCHYGKPECNERDCQ